MKKFFYVSAILLGSAVSLCSCGETDVNNTDQTNNKALIQLTTGEKFILQNEELKAYNSNDTIYVMDVYGSYYIGAYGSETYNKKAVIKKYL